MELVRRMIRSYVHDLRLQTFSCPHSELRDSCSAAGAYQIVLICLEARILASFVTRGMPSANAVAPINRSQGSLESSGRNLLANTATFAVMGRIAVREEILSTKSSAVTWISNRPASSATLRLNISHNLE